MPSTDMRTLAPQLAALHEDLRARAARTATSAPVTLAVVSEPGRLWWAAPIGADDLSALVPNSAALIRRRLAADLRSPRHAKYGAPLAGVLRHRSTPDGVSVTTVMLLDGTAVAYSEGTALSVAVGDWRTDIDSWSLPFELAEALTDSTPVTSPVLSFAERVGVDEYDHDGLGELIAEVVKVCGANPEIAVAAGMDPATASLLGQLVNTPADLSDLLTGRFDPWTPTIPAELTWPAGAAVTGGAL